jgi:hypothetical protein
VQCLLWLGCTAAPVPSPLAAECCSCCCWLRLHPCIAPAGSVAAYLACCLAGWLMCLPALRQLPSNPTACSMTRETKEMREVIALEERTADPQQLARAKQAWQQKVRAWQQPARPVPAHCAGGLLQCTVSCGMLPAALCSHPRLSN